MDAEPRRCGLCPAPASCLAINASIVFRPDLRGVSLKDLLQPLNPIVPALKKIEGDSREGQANPYYNKTKIQPDKSRVKAWR